MCCWLIRWVQKPGILSVFPHIHTCKLLFVSNTERRGGNKSRHGDLVDELKTSTDPCSTVRVWKKNIFCKKKKCDVFVFIWPAKFFSNVQWKVGLRFKNQFLFRFQFDQFLWIIELWHSFLILCTLQTAILKNKQKTLWKSMPFIFRYDAFFDTCCRLLLQCLLRLVQVHSLPTVWWN